MSDIFLSYAKEDRERARRLVRALESTGWSVFWDRTVPAGLTWRRVIANELDAARSVLVLWSAASVESDYVDEEAEAGKQGGILIPVLLESVDPPFGFRTLQAFDLSSWNGRSTASEVQELVASMVRLLGSPPGRVAEEEGAPPPPSPPPVTRKSVRITSACPLRLSALHGPQGVTHEDDSYTGSRYAEVKAALFENPYQEVWGEPGNDPLPVFKSTTGNVFSGSLSGGKPAPLREAAIRTLSSRADLRWGEDDAGYRRILHPNGICLFGTWEITEDNPYSGYFWVGTRGLLIGRLSTDGSRTRRGQTRSLSLAGKLYPTMDENHPESLRPAHFLTQQDVGGERTRHINDAKLRNAPDVSPWRRPLRLPVLLRSGILFARADQEAGVRQLHEIAELGKEPGHVTRTPKYVELRMSAGQERIGGRRLDFRDEVYGHIYDRGDPDPKRTLAFDIWVADEAEIGGFGFRRVALREPQVIGRLVFHDAVASFNGDHVLHFHHPLWRHDRDDPATTIRAGA